MGLRGSGFETILGFLSNMVDDLHPLLDLVMLQSGAVRSYRVSKFPTTGSHRATSRVSQHARNYIHVEVCIYMCIRHRPA